MWILTTNPLQESAINIILAIMMLALLMTLLSNNAFAQPETLHEQTLNEIVKQSPGLNEIGSSPSAMDVTANSIYIANIGSDTVSVISSENYSKIADIPVGDGPFDIDINYGIDKVYVANSDSNTVSVINATDNTRIGEDIPVGDSPFAIAIRGGMVL